MTLGEKLRFERKNRKLKLHELGKLCDLSVGFLSDIERDAYNPSIKSMSKIAEAHKMPLYRLLMGVKI